jgi:hypothetical protein
MDCCDDPEARFLHARGLPVRLDGALPESLFDRIAARHRSARPEFDLVCYGAVPIPESSDKAETRSFLPEYAGAASPELQTLKGGSLK